MDCSFIDDGLPHASHKIEAPAENSHIQTKKVGEFREAVDSERLIRTLSNPNRGHNDEKPQNTQIHVSFNSAPPLTKFYEVIYFATVVIVNVFFPLQII